MSGSYKTPGVYVEEMSKFPPSVAEVETAIPAFIGYTEKATKIVADDLKMVPTRIRSLLDFEQYFGYGPTFTSLTIKLDENNIPVEKETSVANSKYLLYESLRLFYDNGGGSCYIVSVGTYGKTLPDDIQMGDNSSGLRGGLEELKKYDEPTLILFPDAVNLTVDKLGTLQQAALLQCAKLGDRFVIMDVKDSASGNTLADDVEKFRNNIGMNNLKYGSAYHPYVNTVFTKKFRFRDINNNITTPSGSRKIKDLMKDSDIDENGTKIKDRLVALESLIADNQNITTDLAAFIEGSMSGALTIDAVYRARKLDFQSATTPANKTAKLKAIFGFLWDVLQNIDGFIFAYVPATDPKVKTRLLTNSQLMVSTTSYIGTGIKTAMIEMVNLDNEALAAGTGKLSTSGVTFTASSFKSAVLSTVTTPVASNYLTAPDTESKYVQCLAKLDAAFAIFKEGFTVISGMGAGYEETIESSLLVYIPFYKGIINTLNRKITTIPPGGAIAGIYSAIDRDRGVWKAPANVSINSVNGVSEFINDEIQEDLNIDVNAGKSVNAIRPFSGKGVMVWGARTLAGNDNEWRYVPVRRFFNFVEESCKKSTAWVVFEPNDANTWAKVRGQIENFLNNLWRRGALAGAKPEHAYYVNVGLGLTMTSQDINEGKLIVEIGMAAVRPAEFIILRFSHKLQES